MQRPKGRARSEVRGDVKMLDAAGPSDVMTKQAKTNTRRACVRGSERSEVKKEVEVRADVMGKTG